jgi:hypothetical protein
VAKPSKKNQGPFSYDSYRERKIKSTRIIAEARLREFVCRHEIILYRQHTPRWLARFVDSIGLPRWYKNAFKSVFAQTWGPLQTIAILLLWVLPDVIFSKIKIVLIKCRFRSRLQKIDEYNFQFSMYKYRYVLWGKQLIEERNFNALVKI